MYRFCRCRCTGNGGGDIVLADHWPYHDVDVTAFGYKYGQMWCTLLFRIKCISLSEMKKFWKKLQPHTGAWLTGDSFIASEEKVAAIQTFLKSWQLNGRGSIPFNHAQLDDPFIVIRATSDGRSHLNISLMNLS